LVGLQLVPLVGSVSSRLVTFYCPRLRTVLVTLPGSRFPLVITVGFTHTHVCCTRYAIWFTTLTRLVVGLPLYLQFTLFLLVWLPRYTVGTVPVIGFGCTRTVGLLCVTLRSRARLVEAFTLLHVAVTHLRLRTLRLVGCCFVAVVGLVGYLDVVTVAVAYVALKHGLYVCGYAHSHS